MRGIGSFDFIVGTASASGDVINGGTEFVVSGGFSSGTTVNSGGVEAVYDSGSEALNDTINSGGAELVSGGAAVSGSVVESGGVEFVLNGGVATDLIDGGLVDVQAGGLAFATFTSNGGVVELDASQTFSGTIAGFASPAGVTEAIDLRDIAFTSATTVKFTEAANNTSGTLTVLDGTHTANLTLLGQYSTANFTLSSDGNGGTYIKDPALVGSSVSPVLAAHG